MNLTSAIVVVITAGSQDEATRIAELLIEKRLAACVQILPQIQSIYRWNESVEHNAEFVLLAKTTEDNFDTLEREVRAQHSYDVPEIIALPILASSAPYHEWLLKNVGK